MDSRRVGALAGIIGPLVVVSVYALEGSLRPGYDQSSMFLSELSLGPRGFVGIVNGVLYGVLLLVFARGMAAEFPHGTASRWGPATLAICGVGWIGAGVGVMDPLPTPPANFSWHGWLHALAGGLLLSYGSPISCFVLWRRFREDPRWKALARWTLAAGVLTAVLTLIGKMLVWSTLLTGGELRTAWGGLYQRLLFVIWLGWQLTVAVRLSRITK